MRSNYYNLVKISKFPVVIVNCSVTSKRNITSSACISSVPNKAYAIAMINVSRYQKMNLLLQTVNMKFSCLQSAKTGSFNDNTFSFQLCDLCCTMF